MARVESYTADQINKMFFDQNVENIDRFAGKDAVASGLDASGVPDNYVPTSDGANGWAWLAVPAGTGAAAEKQYKGDWNSTTAYVEGDLVSYGDVLWVALIDNSFYPPVESTNVVSGDNGGPGTTYLRDRLVGETPELMTLFAVDADTSIGSIHISTMTGVLNELTIGIADSRPAVGSTTPAADMFVVPTTHIYPEDIGPVDVDGYREVKFNAPIRLLANVDYWIWIGAAGGLGDLSADEGSAWQTPVRVAPSYYADTNSASTYRQDINGTWQQSPYHMFFRLGVATNPEWKAIADKSGAGTGTGGGTGGAVSSVNGQIGDVVLDAAAVGALTQAEADALYSPIGALTQAEADTLYAPAGGGGGGGVTSVNGEVGAVSLSPQDVGAIPAGDITLIDVVTQAEYDALAVKVTTTLYVIQG